MNLVFHISEDGSEIVSLHLGIPHGHIFQIHILNRLRQTKCFLTKLKSNFQEDHIGDECVTLKVRI